MCKLYAYTLTAYMLTARGQLSCYLLISLVNLFLLFLYDLFPCVITALVVDYITAFPLGDSLYGAY